MVRANASFVPEADAPKSLSDKELNELCQELQRG